jgi:hypothetical protein
MPRPKPRQSRRRRVSRHGGVNRARAAGIARARLARAMICCEVHGELPEGCSVYWRRSPPKNCWYVVCGPNVRPMLDGVPKTLLCISKWTGRVLLRAEIRSGG